MKYWPQSTTLKSTRFKSARTKSTSIKSAKTKSAQIKSSSKWMLARGLRIASLSAVVALSACGSSDEPQSGQPAATPNSASGAGSSASNSVAASPTQETTKRNTNVSATGRATDAGESSRASKSAPQQRDNSGDNAAEEKLVSLVADAEARIKACADNPCLHAEMRQLSQQMRTVDESRLNRAQEKRLMKRLLDIQHLAASKSK